MITVQWANTGQMEFCGQEYMDAQYSDAMTDYRRKKGQWDQLRMIMSADDDDKGEDWIVIHDVNWEES